MISAYRRGGELSRSLVAEGVRELCDQERSMIPAVKPEPSRFAVEFELALEQLRMQSASERWRIAAESGRLNSLDWWSVECAIPYWWR